MNVKLHEEFALVSFGESNALHGDVVNNAVGSVVEAVLKALPENDRTLTNVKGVFRECEMYLESVCLLSLENGTVRGR